VESRRQEFHNEKIVFTNGCFDILHKGHLEYLYLSRSLGDLLWVGINSDSSVKSLKGEGRPINLELDRAFMLSSLFFVDFVTIFNESTPIALIQKVRPNIHTKGGDYKAENLIEYQVLKSIGSDIKILPFLEGKSTTKIIQKIMEKN
jgi:rfaE bifunctional protein nucleotidyltransferase chain/domain